MAVSLPTNLGFQSFTLHHQDFGGLITPPTGGAQQRLNRLGNRWGLSVRLPRIRHEAQGRTWIAALVEGLTEGVIVRLPQVDFVNDVTGTPLVNGASQIGSTLNIDGVTPGKIAKYGQFFSLIVSGQRYVYMVRTQTTANGAGQMALPISPMLRKSPGDNDACEFVTPYLQGFLQDDRSSWTIDVARTIGLEFTVFEAA